MEESWDLIDKRKIPDWFQNAKFGIFIHWGPYSVPAYRSIKNEIFGSYSEWYYASVYGDHKSQDPEFHKRMYGNMEYREFGKQFKAELFNPDYILHLIKNSGAKYMVITTKHHDGFCLWDTDNPHKKNWNTKDIGPKRDIVGELRESAIKHNIEFGVYYSIIDWESVPSHRCDGGYFIPEKDVKKYGISKEKYLKEILKPQLYELVEKYEPSLIFSDGGEWDLTEEESGVLSFLTWLYNESKVRDKVVVNDRFYKEMPGRHGDYYSTEYRDKLVDNHPWEESRGIGKSYGYNRAERLEDYMTSKEIIKELVSTVSRGGNFLLNIGPMADGTIPVHEEERLKEVGEWLEFSGESIYDTIPNRTFSEYFATEKEKNIYLFLEQADGKYIKLNVNSKEYINSIDLLGIEKNCKFKKSKNSIFIEISEVEKFYRKLERYGIFVVKING